METTWKIFNMQEDLAYLDYKLQSLKDSAAALAKLNPANQELAKTTKILGDKIAELHSTLAASIEGTAITGEEKIREKVSALYFAVAFSFGRPTDSQLDRVKGLQKEISDATAKGDLILSTELRNVNAALTKSKQTPLLALSHEAWDQKTKK